MPGAVSVHQPPLATADLAPVLVQLGPTPEDFAVTEVPLYAPSGDGDHLYVLVEKRELTTPALARALARTARIPERDVGYAGLKDKHAVTRQWLSLPRSARPVEEWELPPGARVLESSCHRNKLRVGHVKANQFELRFVGGGPDALPRAQAVFARLEERGLPNYFGAQRFGIAGQGLDQALAWLSELGASNGKRRGRAFEQRLLPSVLQSEVYNRYLTLRTACGLSRLLHGEIVRLEGTGSSFRIDDADKEQPRLDAGDLHIQGPMFGPKMRPAVGAALELELQVLGDLELDADGLELLGRFAPGTRRDLLVYPTEVSLAAPTPDTLEVRFTLPSGSYATEVVRQLTHAGFLEARAGRKELEAHVELP